MRSVSTVIEGFKRPEYTGVDRCMPCTILNVIIAAVVAVAISALEMPLVGAVVFGALLLVIYLRGYVIPGTPAITRQYVPDAVLAQLGKSPASSPHATGRFDEDDVLATIRAASMMDEETGRIEPSVHSRLMARCEEPSTDAVAELVDASTTDSVTNRGEATFEVDDDRLRTWVSETALAIDIATNDALSRRLTGWEELPFEDRRKTLTGVRLLVERCPDCGGSVSTVIDEFEHCCRKPHVGFRSSCEDCETVLADEVVPVGTATSLVNLVAAADGESVESISSDEL